MPLFGLGEFVLSSGVRSDFKIDCDHLTDADWRALAWLVRWFIGPFSSVEGIPRGGLKLAEHLELYAVSGACHLIVDDVLTSGGSMERARAVYLASPGAARVDKDDPRLNVVGCVVFARGLLPPWVKALFPMPGRLWVVQPERQAGESTPIAGVCRGSEYEVP